ncbi:hypothetical protein HZS61_007029 [Fusarium oxysporum f. sp. conglutinans]|uniref:Uncharacterized protein n=1 Tax=Fusarium oxysporum f. sp. conglutinans TaxID=100902 RepID=A0A8H6G8N9_FUSOX|nr:hypothetical protein HZS61_007029 [Fusarium oxysporum f. sp. conglutinans]
MSNSSRPTQKCGQTYMFHMKDIETRLANHKKELLEKFQGEHSHPPTQEQWEAYCQARELLERFYGETDFSSNRVAV